MGLTESSAENLAKLSDPNRGRVVGVALSEDGTCFRLFAGMGGRSDGSKNRFYQTVFDLNGNGYYIRTAVHNPDIQKGDPSATLYVAQRSWGGWHVASNGEQTEGIAISLAVGETFNKGQSLYRNEGPKNGYTARITVAAHENGESAYMGRIIPIEGNLAESIYEVYRFGKGSKFSLNPGEGYFTATYDGKGGLGANYDRPWKVLMTGSLEDNMDAIWESWDRNTRAGLVGKEIVRGSNRFTYSFRSIHPGRA